MEDRELLELAAKAVGIELNPMEIKNVTEQGDNRFIGYITDAYKWQRGWFNPLNHDGDALMLAVKLGMRIDIDTECGDVCVYAYKSDGKRFSACETDGFLTDTSAATRKAIVIVAAELGKAK